MRRGVAQRIGAGLLALIGLAGCSHRDFYDPCFTPGSIVAHARFLAVRTDPPSANYAADGSTPTLRVRALLAIPPGDGPARSLRAWLCIPDWSGPGCSTQGPSVVVAAGDPRAMDFSVTVPPELLLASLAGDPLHGFEGARVRLMIQTDNALPTEKDLIFVPGGQRPNGGLELQTVAATGMGGGAGDATIADRSRIQLDVGQVLGLRPNLQPGPGADEAAETYTETDLSGTLRTVREQISYRFYSTPHFLFGSLPRNAAGEPVASYGLNPVNVAPEPGVGLLQPLMQLNSVGETVGQVWVVARDGRGAEAWMTFEADSADNRARMEGSKQAALEFGCNN